MRKARSSSRRDDVVRTEKKEQWPVIWGSDSGAIDRRICDLYSEGILIREIGEDPGVGISYGSVLKRLGRLRKRGLIPYRSEPKNVKQAAAPFLCPRCGSTFDSKVEAELCCAAEEEISDVLRRCGL